MKIKNYFQSIIFGIITLISANTLSAQSKFYEIEGFSLRIGKYDSTHAALFEDVNEILVSRDEDVNKNQYLLEKGDGPIFPFGIEFKTNRDGRWYKRLKLNYYSDRLVEDNLPYDPALRQKKVLVTETGSQTYLRQSLKNQNFLYNQILNEQQKLLADNNPNWAVSSDVKYNFSYDIAYYWGYNLIDYNTDRYLLIEPGIGFTYYSKVEQINFCSSFPIKYNEKTSDYSAKCDNKVKIDEYKFTSSNFYLVGRLILYEFENKNHILRLFNIELYDIPLGGIMTIGDQYPPKVKGYKYKFEGGEEMQITFEYVYKI